LGGVITECKGLIHQLHKNTMKIEKDWKHYCKYSKLQKGDKILSTLDPAMEKVVGVTKVNYKLLGLGLMFYFTTIVSLIITFCVYYCCTSFGFPLLKWFF